MNPEIFFSIIIPTYNRADLIKSTLQSALAQTYSRFEIIVVDDGSTDGTDKIVALINSEKISYIYKKNEERAAARNFGINKSRGDYVCFLDSDDLLYPNHLSEAVKTIKKYHMPEFFSLGFDFKLPEGNIIGKCFAFPEIANDNLVDGNNFSCNGMFVRRDIALRFRFNETRVLSGTEDYELWLRLAARFPLYHNPTITSSVVQHDERSVFTSNARKLLDRIETMEKSLSADSEFLRRFGDRFPTIKANNRLYMALNTAATKDLRSTVRYLMAAVRHSLRVLGSRSFYGPLKKLVTGNKY